MTKGDDAADVAAEEKALSVPLEDGCSHVRLCKLGRQPGQDAACGRGSWHSCSGLPGTEEMPSPWACEGCGLEAKRHKGLGGGHISRPSHSRSFSTWAQANSYRSCKALCHL